MPEHIQDQELFISPPECLNNSHTLFSSGLDMGTSYELGMINILVSAETKTSIMRLVLTLLIANSLLAKALLLL